MYGLPWMISLAGEVAMGLHCVTDACEFNIVPAFF